MLSKLSLALALTLCIAPVLADESDAHRCVRIGQEIDQMMGAPDFLKATGRPYDEHQVKVFEMVVEYGVDAVPFVVQRMKDFRPLATQWLPLPNRRAMLPNEVGKQRGFENIVQYRPERVVDALAAILNYLTHQPDPNFIYNGAVNDEVRHSSIRYWQDYLQNRFYVDHPEACRSQVLPTSDAMPQVERGKAD